MAHPALARRRRAVARRHGASRVARAGQRRSRIHRGDPARPAAPASADILPVRDGILRALAERRAAAGLDVSAATAVRARPDRPDRAGAGRARCGLFRADHLLLRSRPHGMALAGIAAHHPIHGRGRHAVGRARGGGAGIHRHRRPGDPARGGRHGRRHRARARARRRARDLGGERGLRPRARLQRQRSAHPRPAPGARQPARQPGRPSRADPRRHQRRPSRSQPRRFPGRRAGRRTGERSVAADHARAVREGRTHYARARQRRRHDDTVARGARGRPARPPRTVQPGHGASHHRRQRAPDRDADVQDRSHRRRVQRHHQHPPPYDVGAARAGDRGIRAEIRDHPRPNDEPFTGTDRSRDRYRQPARRYDFQPHRGGQHHAQEHRRLARARPELARRGRGVQARADRRRHHRRHRAARRAGDRTIPQQRRIVRGGDRQPRRLGGGGADPAAAFVRGDVQPRQRRARRGDRRPHRHRARNDHRAPAIVRGHVEQRRHRAGGADRTRTRPRSAI